MALALTPLVAACDSAPSDPFVAAQEALAGGEPRTALGLVEQAVKTDPNNPAVRLLAGDVAMALDEADRAITEYGAVMEDAEAYSLARAKLADAQLEGEYFTAAGETLQSLTLDNPTAYAAWVKYHLSRGESDEALKRLAAGLSAFPKDPNLITFDAERVWREGKPRAALERLEDALAAKPAVAEAHRFAAQLRLHFRDVDQAEEHFKTVLNVRPLDQIATLGMAAIANGRGDEQQAQNWLNKMSQNGEPSSAWLLFMAQMAYNSEEYEKAFTLIEEAPGSMANSPEFTRLRGLIDARRGQHAMASLALGDYVKSTGGDVFTRQVLASSLGEQGKFSEGWAAIAPVLDHPQMGAGGLNVALQLAERAAPSEAPRVRALMEKSQKAPTIDAEMREAGLAIRAGDWAKADSIYTPLVDGKGAQSAALLNNAAAVKTKLGEHEAAVMLARRALVQAPASPEIKDTLGWALWQKGGSVAEARQLISEARQAAPGNTEIAEHWVIVQQGA